jgi:hypothetical protein
MKIAVFLVLAACSSPPAAPDAPHAADARAIDAPPPVDAAPDAPGPDLACLGQPPPATAPDPLPVEGKVFAVDHYDVAPVTGATVVLRRRGTDAMIAQATTAADGAFAMSVASGGVPVDGYFAVAAAGYRPTRVEPGDPLSGGENALMLVAGDAELARWYAAAGATFTAGAPTLITASVDCARDTLDGSTLAVTPSPGAVTYYDTTAKQWDATLAASTNGFALVTAPAATVSATTSLGATSLPPHTVTVPAGTLTIAVLTPHS